MKITYLTTIIIALAGLLSGCTAPTLYNLRTYDALSYGLIKKADPKLSESLDELYRQMIANPQGTRKQIPPGILAEYGYRQLKMGRKEQAIEMFKREMALYPESAILIRMIIKKIEQ